MGGIFGRVDAWITALVLAGAMIGTWYLGWRRGRALQARDKEAPLGKLDDASIVLLGLLLAFTFSMAVGKHDRRREMVIEDSNSIGDFYTCASLLSEPVRSPLQKLIREYTELRLELMQHQPDEAAVAQELKAFRQMHDRMTDLVAQAIQQGTPITVPLTDTLNALTSNHAAYLAAVRDRLPTSIVGLLFLSSVMATMLVGRQQGASPRPNLAGTLSFVVLVSLVVYMTLDLNQPFRGLIRVSQGPMEHVLASMKP